ncbi:MAG: hypothetical protein ACYC4M_10670 [Thermoleophilia bacterium]
MSLADKSAAILKQVRWADSSIERLTADYDSVTITITESSGRKLSVRFLSHIALIYPWHWDENIIDSCHVLSESPLIDTTLNKIVVVYGDNPEKGGGTREFGGPWCHYSVHLEDGAKIEIVAQDVELVG